MPEPSPQLDAANPAVVIHDPKSLQDAARDTALQRVCAGFVTTISPRSAARLASLLSAASYVQAA